MQDLFGTDPNVQIIDPNDPFAKEDEPKKPTTVFQRFVKQIGNAIGYVLGKFGALLIDKELRGFMILLAVIVFITGIVRSVIWIFTHWKISLVLFSLFLIWRIASKVNKHYKKLKKAKNNITIIK